MDLIVQTEMFSLFFDGHLELPDPNDRPVLAAAIRGGAHVIVTANLRDFPAKILGQFGIEAQHPDDFVLHLLDLRLRESEKSAEDD